MKTRIVILLSLVWVGLIFTNSVLGQAKVCDIRLNVFLVNETEQPQSIVINDVDATAVNLSDNKITKARKLGGKSYFDALPNGEYNIAISKTGYQITSEVIRLNCRMADEKNVFDETIFTVKEDFKQIWKFPPNNFSINLNPPPPSSPSGIENPKEKHFLHTISAENLNDRITYLPKVKLSEEMQKYSDSIKKNGRPLVAIVSVIVDGNGNVISAKSDERTTKQIPDLIETVLKAKFLPLKVDGQKVMFSGEFFYQY